MKIAIASTSKEESSKVSDVVGRAAYYLIYEDGGLAETIKNPFAVGGGGAGLSVTQMLNDKGVNMIVGGKFGPNVIEAIKEKNMSYEEVTDMTIFKALEKVTS